MNCSPRNAVTDGSIRGVVLRDAGHKTVKDGIRIDDSGLINGWSSTSAKFKPCDPGLFLSQAASRSYLNCLTAQKRFVGAKVPVPKTPHDAIADRIYVIVHLFPVVRRLRNTECVGHVCDVVAARCVGRHGQGGLGES